MDRGHVDAPEGLLRIEDCLDADGNVVLPAGVTLISLIDRNIANVGDTIAYRYLDYSRSAEPAVFELTWTQLGQRLRAIAAHVQRSAARGDRVAILAPQGLDYIAGFFAAIKAGTIAVPLFAPELPGHAERLDTALGDSQPTLVLTTAAAADSVRGFLAKLPSARQPQLLIIDEIPDSSAADFVETVVDVDDVSHLQYTSGSTRPPAGVEITHRAVGTNLIQMILSIDLLDRNTHGVSWLPLYHDMGLSMIGFPTVYGGHSTLLSPTAFIRRPQRWIRALSDASRTGHVITAAPNFAYEWTAARGLPDAGDDIDLSNVVMIIGSEPVSADAIATFSEAFAPHGLPPTSFKPSYGIAEATLFVATIAPTAQPTVIRLDRERLAQGLVQEAGEDADAITQVSCGQVARSLWAAIVDPATGEELPDGRVGEIWLHGNNVGRGYWGQPEESRRVFGARLVRRRIEDSHAGSVPADGAWLRTGDLGFYRGGELYVAGRLADIVVLDGRTLYPHDIERTAADSSALVRGGYVAAFTVPRSQMPGATTQDAAEQLVIIAERAAGTSRSDPAAAIAAIRSAVVDRHGIEAADVRLLPAGAIPRTTSGKLARRACRAEYLSDALRVR
ncbi:fatty acyl-AMP ligase [Mycolicibacterium psychrotolerans]|uniref:fatty acyl-AMP ligase n=1 Tax=Mycolicibacterium psychrotolerans TaxID=216929 RepID=UPI003D66E842